MKKKEEILLLTCLVEQLMAKVMEAMRLRLGDSDLENLQDALGTLGPGISALHDRPGF